MARRARRGRGGRFTKTSSRRSSGGGGGGGGGARRSSNGPSPKAIKEKARTTALATGGVSAIGFGYLQNKVDLPRLEGVPNSLTYGAAALIVGVFTGSELLINASQGPLFAGLHAVGKTGGSLKQAAEIAGTDENLFPEVAGDFDDL